MWYTSFTILPIYIILCPLFCPEFIPYSFRIPSHIPIHIPFRIPFHIPFTCHSAFHSASVQNVATVFVISNYHCYYLLNTPRSVRLLWTYLISVKHFTPAGQHGSTKMDVHHQRVQQCHRKRIVLCRLLLTHTRLRDMRNWNQSSLFFPSFNRRQNASGRYRMQFHLIIHTCIIKKL